MLSFIFSKEVPAFVWEPFQDKMKEEYGHSRIDEKDVKDIFEKWFRYLIEVEKETIKQCPETKPCQPFIDMELSKVEVTYFSAKDKALFMFDTGEEIPALHVGLKDGLNSLGFNSHTNVYEVGFTDKKAFWVEKKKGV